MEGFTLFQKWEEFLGWILDRTEGFPKSVRYTFSERIALLALDILEEIIECHYNSKKKEKLSRINLNLEKLRVYARLSYQRKYVSMNQYEYFSRELDEVGKAVGAWMKSCRE